MKIIKFPQSCLLVETKNKRILIDPGNINFNPDWLTTAWSRIDLILITHKHLDHCYPKAIEPLQKKGVSLLSTREVAHAYPELRVQIVRAGEILNSAGPRRQEAAIRIEVTRAVHGYLPSLKGEKEINENIGFIIDDGSRKLYVTSDTICFPHSYRCDIIALPISGHGLCLGTYDAAMFAQDCGVSQAILQHFDNPKYPVDIDAARKCFANNGLGAIILNVEESTEL